jgi:hypothetical protein
VYNFEPHFREAKLPVCRANFGGGVQNVGEHWTTICVLVLNAILMYVANFRIIECLKYVNTTSFINNFLRYVAIQREWCQVRKINRYYLLAIVPFLKSEYSDMTASVV